MKAPAIVQAAERNFALEQDEVFLVQEKIDGKTLRELAFRDWRGLGPLQRETVAKKLAWDFWQFWTSLFSAGWFYSDLSPANLMIERTPLGLRVLDAGSAVRAQEQVMISGYSPAFTTPKLLEGFTSSTPMAGTAAVMFPMLTKILHFLSR